MHSHLFRTALLLSACVPLLASACGGSDTNDPTPRPDQLTLTDAQVRSLDSTGRVIEQANPANGNIKSFVDSTLLVLTAGIVAKRLDVVTDVTTSPLYFVGIHRVVSQGNGSFSTWNVVGMDDPSHLTSIVEVGGYAPSAGATAPTSVSEAIGGVATHAYFLTVGAGGVVTEWFANSGSASFASGPAGAPCPNFTATGGITCSLETMHVHFSASASSGTNGAGARQATVGADVDVPTMRLTYGF